MMTDLPYLTKPLRVLVLGGTGSIGGAVAQVLSNRVTWLPALPGLKTLQTF